MKIGIIGAGDHVVRNILPALADVSGLSPAAILVRAPEKYAPLAASLGVALYTDADAFFLRPDVQAIFIASPIPTHFKFARRALLAGKHAWCEKTITTTHEEAVELAQIAAETGLMVAEAAMYLHHRQFDILRQVIHEAGQVGGTKARFHVPDVSATSPRYAPSEGGGGLLDQGFYPLSLAHALFGMPDDISAEIAVHTNHRVDNWGRAALDYGAFNFDAGWCMGCDYQNMLEVQFDQGKMRVERVFSKPGDLRTVIRFEGMDRPDIVVPPDNHFVNMLAEFAAKVDDEDYRAKAREAFLARSLIVSRVKQAATDKDSNI